MLMFFGGILFQQIIHFIHFMAKAWGLPSQLRLIIYGSCRSLEGFHQGESVSTPARCDAYWSHRLPKRVFVRLSQQFASTCSIKIVLEIGKFESKWLGQEHNTRRLEIG